MINLCNYRKFEELTIADIELLEQAYQRCVAEGYAPAFDWDDFLNIVIGRADHKVTEYEMELIEENL